MSYIKIVYSQRLASSYVSRSMPSKFFRTLSVIKQPIGKDWCRRLILSGLLCLFLFLGLGPICDKFRIWASNLVICFIYLSNLWVILVLVILFRICFTSICYLSLRVMFVFISYHVVFFVFIHVKCHLIVS